FTIIPKHQPGPVALIVTVPTPTNPNADVRFTGSTVDPSVIYDAVQKVVAPADHSIRVKGPRGRNKYKVSLLLGDVVRTPGVPTTGLTCGADAWRLTPHGGKLPVAGYHVPCQGSLRLFQYDYNRLVGNVAVGPPGGGPASPTTTSSSPPVPQPPAK